ncbi:TetR/AcrR family transcriptional regulator [Nocardiopsis lambiniae]|uniref:TetR/AcrR family transcriptional regulator n=1 Tax=Nocardiopsis lambiniae TaxID=3075539 RepID=A0ABU2M361_9ACTN|nr:TetR/AcrR family transcriptional regulator [Nocardiopsis sp. DSM 44743]MDT0327024.1 TetR/AcrR family transcriptional regulator [Nocardiopsis sp. DSM 44743]
MGRTSDARDRILDSSRRLMRTRGYTALGVAEICAEAGVKKGSFYHFFDSKQALTVETVDGQWTEERRSLEASLEDADGPVDRLRALIECLIGVQRADYGESGTIHGCLYGNLAAEVSEREPEVRRRLVLVFDEQVDMIADLVARARSAGLIGGTGTEHALARALVAQIEGTVLLARVRNDPTLLDDVWPNAERLLGLG